MILVKCLIEIWSSLSSLAVTVDCLQVLYFFLTCVGSLDGSFLTTCLLHLKLTDPIILYSYADIAIALSCLCCVSNAVMGWVSLLVSIDYHIIASFLCVSDRAMQTMPIPIINVLIVFEFYPLHTNEASNNSCSASLCEQAGEAVRQKVMSFRHLLSGLEFGE